MSKRRNKKNQRKNSGLSHSTIEQHKRDGKKLIPPLAQIPGMQLQSWRDDRLPELLWAVLLTNLNRDRYLELFRRIAAQSRDLKGYNGSVYHSELARLDADEFDALLKDVLFDAEARTALQPLLYFEELPDRSHWLRHLQPLPDRPDLSDLARAVANNSFHQSQAATDCRWLWILSMIGADKVRVVEGMAERLEEIVNYPNQGDMRAVRPTIRSMEGAFALLMQGDQGTTPPPWAPTFWRTCWETTPCMLAPRKPVEYVDTAAVVTQLVETYHAVVEHFHAKTETTELDARKDAAFGLALYGLNLALTLNHGTTYRRAEGRLVIRTLVESYVTLAFLVKRDNSDLWLRYRKYGTGQAKLAFLKLVDLEADELPEYVNAEELEALASEDVWQELSEVDIGNWAGSDLRKMSEEAGVKAIYDKYYGWPSGFVHGQWAAVRDTAFDLCLNPLHRLHRIPSVPRIDMGSVAADALKLSNLLLDQLNTAFPPFRRRLSPPKPAATDGKPIEDNNGTNHQESDR